MRSARDQARRREAAPAADAREDRAFWATLWNECLAGAVFVDLEEARIRIGLFVDHYNFHRTHQGIDGCVPTDRFFQAAPEVKATLTENFKVADALGLNGTPSYVIGNNVVVGAVGLDQLKKDITKARCGEAGCSGGLPTVANAVIDALADLGIRDLPMPMTPARVWEAIDRAKQKKSA